MSESTSTVVAMALYTVHGDDGEAPSLATAASQLGVAPDDLDATFGVVPIDPQAGMYAVQARSDRVHLATEGEHRYPGPYSCPPIEPCGPPAKDDEED